MKCKLTGDDYRDADAVNHRLIHVLTLHDIHARQTRHELRYSVHRVS